MTSDKSNRICTMLGIDFPIFLGGMAHVSHPSLVASVSNSGGLGILASGGMDPSKLTTAITETSRLTDKPFGVNLMLLEPNVEKKIDIVCNSNVSVVTTGAGNPTKYLSKFQNAKIKVFPVVASSALARRVARYGVQGIIAEGTEAGGHVGEVTTMVLVPKICDLVTIPVIAAGGIGDGRGMAAALSLGAEGVQVGTRFAAATESPVHKDYKQAIYHANERATTVTGKSLNAPVRTIANKMTKKFKELEQKGTSRETLERLASGGLSRAVTEGDLESGSLMSGQIAGLIEEEKSVKEIINEMITTCREILTNHGF